MNVRIDRRGGIFYIYKNYKVKGQSFDYVAQVAAGWRWAWKEDELTVYDNQKREAGYLYFKRRIFRPSSFYFHLKDGDRQMMIEPAEAKSFRDFIFDFEYDGASYKFSTHRAHHKSLFRNGTQVAAFDKQFFHFLNRDTYVIFSEDDVPLVMLVCLSLFDQLNKEDDSTFTIDLGNILGSNPPDKGQWKPSSMKHPLARRNRRPRN